MPDRATLLHYLFFTISVAYGYRAHQYYALLGDLYGQKLALSQQQVLWLNKFDLPQHGFMQVEVARAACVRLFVAVVNELEVRCKANGSTLPKRVRTVVDATEQYDYVYVRNTYQHINRDMAGHKVGAAIFLTIFQHCENVVRRHFDFQELDADRYYSELNDPEGHFNRYFGAALPALLAPLAATLPALDAATEQALNLADPKRWQPRFEQLLALLPASPAPFEAAIHALSEQNCRTPNQSTIYQRAAWQLGAAGGEATIRLYLHYLHHGRQRYPFKIKLLPKRAQKALLPRPEHLARFEALTEELLCSRDLPAALAAVPAIYHQERRKIQLDFAAVQATRALHSTTVELLNEYLQEPPDPAPAPPPAPPKAVAAKPKATRPAASNAPESTSPPVNFAAGLTLSAGQRALAELFAASKLALSLNQVEALARQHNALRNQLIDGLNDACYALLDDVLVEEADGGYVIHAPYFQKITS